MNNICERNTKTAYVVNTFYTVTQRQRFFSESKRDQQYQTRPKHNPVLATLNELCGEENNFESNHGSESNRNPRNRNPNLIVRLLKMYVTNLEYTI